MTFFISKNDEESKSSSCFLSCYQPCYRARDYPFRFAFYAATCCRIIFCVEDDGKMTMMSTGWRRKITFYDGIAFAAIPFHYAWNSTVQTALSASRDEPMFH